MLNNFDIQMDREKCRAQALLAMALNEDLLVYLRELAKEKDHCQAIVNRFELRAQNIRGRHEQKSK